MVAGSQDARRLGALDGLRGLAALGILVLHVWMYDFGDGGRQPRWLGDHVVEGMRLGVPLFFALSGFLLYRPFVGAVLDGRRLPRLGSYALRRAARVVPAYWAAALAAFLLMRWLDHPYAVELSQLPIFLVFGQNYVGETAKHLDPPMWTLVVEASFYLLLPMVALAALRLGAGRGRQVALCLALVTIGIGLTELARAGAWPWTARATLVTHLPSFAAGMLAAVLLHRRELSARWGAALLGAGAALVVGDVAMHVLALGPPELRVHLRDTPALVGVTLVIAALAGSPVRARVLTAAPVRALGTLSYGLYLWHYLVIVFLREMAWWPEQMGEALLLTTLLSLPLAAFSWFALEQPAQRWARDRTAKRRRGRERQRLGQPVGQQI